MKAGRTVGFSLLVSGIILSIIFFYLMREANGIPRILIAGPAVTVIGLTLLLFPGPDLKMSDLKGRDPGKVLWRNASKLDKIAWVSGIVFGCFVSILLFIKL